MKTKAQSNRNPASPAVNATAGPALYAALKTWRDKDRGRITGPSWTEIDQMVDAALDAAVKQPNCPTGQ